MSLILIAFWLEHVIFCYFITQIISIMSSDSPTDGKDYFNFGRSTPPPTTSTYISARIDYEGTSTTDAATAALIETKKSKEKNPNEDKEDKEKEDNEEKDDKDKDRPLGPGENRENDAKYSSIAKDGDKGDRRDDKGDKDDKRKGNNNDKNNKIPNGDCLEANWKTEPKVEDEDDDSAIVKCLYYTMQCCECTIS